MWEEINKYRKERPCPQSHFDVFGREVMHKLARHSWCEFDFDLQSMPELTKGLLFGGGRKARAKKWCEKQLNAGKFMLGDNHVEKDVLEELMCVSKILEEKGIHRKN